MKYFNTSPCMQAAANNMCMLWTFYLMLANDMHFQNRVGVFKAMVGTLSCGFGAKLTLFNFLNST